MKKEWEEEEQEEKEQDPAFLFYSADFLVGVTDLSYEERGQYITLLCLQHQKGHLSARTMKDMKISEAVMDKFLRDAKGRYYNKRLDKEKRKRENFIKSKVENGKKGGRPPKNLNESYSFSIGKREESNSKATENLLENENENIDFNTLVKDSTEAMSLSDSAFSFSNDNNDNNLLSTTTTKSNCYLLYRDGENEDGLLSEELEAIGEFLAGYFDDLSASEVFDIQCDFIAYNKAKRWRGIGGEDVRQDITRYLRRWIKYDYPERKKRR